MTRNCKITGSVVYDECYSSFVNPWNILEKEGPFNTFSSTAFGDYRLSSFVLNGFFCYDHNLGFFTNHGDNHWWMIDLNRVVTVESIILIIPYGEPYIKSSNIRLGNNASFTNNDVVFRVEKEPEKGMPFVIKLSSNYSGQFLSIETNDVNYLGIGLIQIIET